MAYTEAELKKMKLADLKEVAESDYDLDIEGLKKVDLVKAILDHESASEADLEDDDELEDDELEEDEDVEEDDEEDDSESELDDEEDDEEDEPAPEPKKAKAKKKAKDTDGEATLAAKQVASLLNTDPKTLRQFFRSSASTTEAVGSGGRYEFYESDVDQIRTEFAEWFENKSKRGRPSEGGSKSKKKDKVRLESEIVPEAEELDDLDELEDDELDDELDDDELDED